MLRRTGPVARTHVVDSWAKAATVVDQSGGRHDGGSADQECAMKIAVIGATGRAGISVEGFAMALADELEQRRHSRKRFTVGY
jgi:hypothetical protein